MDRDYRACRTRLDDWLPYVGYVNEIQFHTRTGPFFILILFQVEKCFLFVDGWESCERRVVWIGRKND